MTPPRITGGPPTPPSIPPVEGSLTSASSRETLFTPDPMLGLPADPSNPLYFEEAMQTTGDVLGQYEKLGRSLPGTKIMMSYGSFPGNTDPNLDLGEWDIDKKPDVIYIGDAKEMLTAWAKHMGWDGETTRRQIDLTKQGLVYYNGAAESAQGSIPHKVGFMDIQALRSVVPGADATVPRGFPPGFFYFMYRASLLPMTDQTFRAIGVESAEMAGFRDLVKRSAVGYMGHAVDSFWLRRSFSGKQLARRRYFNQFVLYDWSRAFGLLEIRKGRKQFKRYQDEAGKVTFLDWIRALYNTEIKAKVEEAKRKHGKVPEILAPAVRQYFIDHETSFEVSYRGKFIKPTEINSDNLFDLHFRDLRSLGEKWNGFRQVRRHSRWIQRWAIRQSKNAGRANSASRRSPLTPSKADYLIRKGVNAVGMAPEYFPRSYTYTHGVSSTSSFKPYRTSAWTSFELNPEVTQFLRTLREVGQAPSIDLVIDEDTQPATRQATELILRMVRNSSHYLPRLNDQSSQGAVEHAKEVFKLAIVSQDGVVRYVKEKAIAIIEEAMNPDSGHWLRKLLLVHEVDRLNQTKLSRLSPEEYRTVYPHLVAALREVEKIESQVRECEDLNSNLRRGFSALASLHQLYLELDRTFVDKVGESPPAYRRPSGLYHKVTNPFPHSNEAPQVARNEDKSIRYVNTAVWSPQALETFRRVEFSTPEGGQVRYNILPSRLPYLMAEASLPNTKEGKNSLDKLTHDRWSYERLSAWKDSEKGRAYLQSNQAWLEDRFSNRFQESGIGLIAGGLTLWGMESWADELGLDAETNPHERFMAVAGGAHLVNGAINRANQVRINRKLGIPFDFATRNAVNTGASWGWQHRLDVRPSASRAYLGAVLHPYTQAYSFSSPMSAIKEGLKGLALFPIRTSLNMGPGLMSAALVDKVFSETLLNLAPDSQSRRMLHTGSFFLPEAWQTFVGERGMRVFRSAPLRVASRVFSYGMIADLGISGLHRLHFGGEASFQNHVAQLANELRDEAEDATFLDSIFEFVAPQFAAWWDSTEGLSFKPNKYRREAERQLRAQAKRVATDAKISFQGLLREGFREDQLTESFYQNVDFSFLSERASTFRETEENRRLPLKSFAEDMNVSSFVHHLEKLPTMQQKIQWVKDRYCGWDLSDQDVLEMFHRVQIAQVSGEVRALAQMRIPELSAIGNNLNEKGGVKSGQESQLLRGVFVNEEMSEEQLLSLRRSELIYKIMKRRAENAKSEELRRLESLAKKLNLLKPNGDWNYFTDFQAIQSAKQKLAIYNYA